ncbi:MAG: type IV toxin-antitoxin system AbiEi family antitoxin [Candidatus Omnitrophica bacterium]|nr:type IV toxin-antitoxin system AbiEi family antitoxin [Candidatus Omnitrophota bacterium]
MNRQNNEKINQLYLCLPEGVIAPGKWLQDKGYSRQRVYNYVKGGWLKSVGKGAYSRPTTEVSWQGLVASWQHIESEAYHVGGETALNVQGFSHYLRLAGENLIYLVGSSKVPSWVRNVALNVSLRVVHKQLFRDVSKNVGFTEIKSPIKDWPLKVSSPERAMMEVLVFVKDEFSFTFAAELMEGLTTLRPSVVNELLHACGHVAVKRLFLFLAGYYKHPWIETIDKAAVGLGKGKRHIVDKGKLNKAYLITVPERFNV